MNEKEIEYLKAVCNDEFYEFDDEQEKHKFMRYTILYRAETIKQVLSKGRLLHYWTTAFNPGGPEDLKRLREEKLSHDVMEYVYGETIEWPIVNVFRNHLRGHVPPQHGIVKAVKRRKILMKDAEWKNGFVTKEEVEKCSPHSVPVAENLGVDFNWAGIDADPRFGISIGLLWLTDHVEYISMSLMHEYTHWVVYSLEGEKASTCLDNFRVRLFLEECIPGYNGKSFHKLFLFPNLDFGTLQNNMKEWEKQREVSE